MKKVMKMKTLIGGLFVSVMFSIACTSKVQQEDFVKDDFDFASRQLKFALTQVDSVED